MFRQFITRKSTWAALLLTLLVIAGCGIGGPAYAPKSSATAASVDMGFMSFKPAVVSIRAGQAVEWRNTSPATHTVTDQSSLPRGAEAFDSGDIPAGQVYMRKFTTPGTYGYFCRHHKGMVGSVIVTP
jgi:plastocyanin